MKLIKLIKSKFPLKSKSSKKSSPIKLKKIEPKIELTQKEICEKLIHKLSYYQFEISKVQLKGVKGFHEIKTLSDEIKYLLYLIKENGCILEAVYPGNEPKIKRKNSNGKSLLLRSPITVKDDIARILYGTNGKINKNKVPSQLMKDLLDDINELKISPIKRKSSTKKSNVLMNDLLDF
jgi:hypothetical protein